jgi:hypothetical protein
MGILVVDRSEIAELVVLRIIGQSVAMPEFPELSDYIVPSPYYDQYVIDVIDTQPITTPDKSQARRFHGTEGALAILPKLFNLRASLELVAQ